MSELILEPNEVERPWIGSGARANGTGSDLTKKIGLLLASRELFTLIYQLIRSLLHGRPYSGGSYYFGFVFSPLILLLLGLCLLLKGEAFAKGSHIFIMAANISVSIRLDNNPYYIVVQVFLLLLILFKYGYLMRNRRVKLFLFSLAALIILEVSLIHSDLFEKGQHILFYVVFFLLFLYFIYKDEMKGLLYHKKKKHAQELARLKRQKMKIQNQMNRLKDKLRNMERRLEREVCRKEQVNLDAYGLTRSEKKIVSTLVRYKVSNREIGSILGIKEQTVKSHLYHVYNKIGIDSRSELIGLFYPPGGGERAT